MEFTGLTSASHMSLPEAGYGSEEGYVGSEISGAVSGVTTPGASRLQASQLTQRSTTMQRLHVAICLGDETVTQHCRVLDTDAFDIVIGMDFLRRNLQVKMLTLQRPYSLHCDFGSGLFSVPLELSGRKESGLR